MFVGGGGGSRENWGLRGDDDGCVVEGTQVGPGVGGGCTVGSTETVFTGTRYRKRVSTVVGIGYLGRVWVIGTEVKARDSLRARNLGMYPIYNSRLLRFLTQIFTVQCSIVAVPVPSRKEK